MRPQQRQPQNQQPPQRTNLHSLLNKKSGATLMELMMMLLVVSLALTTMFYTLTQTITFARDTEARVKAVGLAREGIEALINIRNTNWLRFSSDRKNCWDSLNYNPSCIGNVDFSDKIVNGNYKLFFENNLWKLEQITDNKPTPIYINNDGWYTGD